MRVISLRRLREFWEQHGDAEKPLRNWFKTARKARWGSLQDVRRTYPRTDSVATFVNWVTSSSCSASAK